MHIVKPVSSGHLKIGRTKVFKTDGSLMQVESIAECSLGAGNGQKLTGTKAQ